MAAHKEGNDLVIDSWEQGIADAPEQGITFMRNINLVSIPGEAPVNYKTAEGGVPPAGTSGASCTLTASTNAVTWTTGGVTLYSGAAVMFGSTAGGVTAATVYWISNVTNGSTGSFKVYTDIGHSQVVTLSNASNTFTVIPFGKPKQKAIDSVNKYVFMLDDAGRAWWINSSSNLVFLGNTTLTSTHGNGLCVFGNYLFVFRDSAIDYFPITYITSTSTPVWTYGWNSWSITTDSSTGYSHYAIAAQDNGMYFCNGQNIQSILVVGGSVFDPTNSATYTATLPSGYALLLPTVDRAVCLAELGTSLLVGGIQNKIYPWDRVSTSYSYPVIVAESYITRMVTTNSSTYVFAGNRGRIYITNGANINLFKKVPDHIVGIFGASNGTDPYYTWLDAIYWKNQIFFSFTVTKNDGTAVTNMGGLWALDVSMNIMGTATAVGLRMTNTLSQGATFFPHVIAPNVNSNNPAGTGLYLGWSSATTTSYGIDVTTSNPYSDLSTEVVGEIYTDLIKTGTYIAPLSFTQVEWKLAEPLVSGEKVRISIRQSYSDAWTVVGTTDTAGVLSAAYDMPVQNGQWVQFYIELQSTTSSPSFVRLKEIRVR